MAPRKNTTGAGNRTEAAVLAAFVAVGHLVALPFGDGAAYDLILDEDGRLSRVQCKTGRIVRGALVFNTCSSQRTTGKTDYRGRADLFAVLSPDGRIYVIPVDDCPSTEMRLRLGPTLNKQAKLIRWARDYELRP